MNMKYAMRSEDTEQINVVSWANWNMNRYPELRWLFHVPNGGSRNKQEAVKFKQMGVKAGVSDLCLPYPKVIDRGDGRYRYLTERECWRLMGYTDEDFDRAKAVQQRNGKYYKALYDQAGNSIAVPIFESIFRKIILHEVA